EDVVQAYLRRINQFDRTDSPQPLTAGGDQQLQPLNSYMRVNPHALRDASKLNPNAGGPLFGIPVIVKDNIATLDMPTTAGSVPASPSATTSPRSASELRRRARSSARPART